MSKLDSAPSAITVEVDDLVRRARAGQIHVPHFQRGLRWDRRDVKRLIESIVKGYPVGSLLLWQHPAPATDLKLGAIPIHAEERQDAWWVVDGQQRITSIVNALTAVEEPDPRFTLFYDLAQGEVSDQESSKPQVVPLHILYNLPSLLEYMQQTPAAMEYFDVATEIATRLRQYKIPAYVVTANDIDLLKDIFDRLNSFGKKLDRAEVFQALNAPVDISGTRHTPIEDCAVSVNDETAFGTLNSDTVLQCLLAIRNPDYSRDLHDEFDEKEDPSDAYTDTTVALIKAINFIQHDARIPHLTFLPYSFVLVVLSRFFGLHPTPNPRQRVLLRRWVWRCCVLGQSVVTGGVPSAGRIMTRLVTEDANESLVSMLGRLPTPTSPHVAWPNSFKANTAVCQIILCAMAERLREHHSEAITPHEINRVLENRKTASALVEDLYTTTKVGVELSRSPGNKVLWVGAEESFSANLAAGALIPPEPYLITDEQLQQYTQGSGSTLVQQRNALVRSTTNAYTDRWCEWNHDDSPPTEDLVIDE